MTREQLLSRRSKPKPVTIPEIGEYHLRSLTLAETEQLVEQAKDLNGLKQNQLMIAVRLCDEQGKSFDPPLTLDEVASMDMTVISGLIKYMNAEGGTSVEQQATDAKN